MYEIPVRTTLKDGKYSVYAQWVEAFLRPPRSPLLDRPFEPKLVELRNGRKMVIRMATEKDLPLILDVLRDMINLQIDVDFFDLVAARTYAEILAILRKRIKDEWVMIGVLDDGTLAGQVNARLWNDKIAISLHTIVFKRRLGAGLPMYLAKMEYAFETLGVEEWWPTFESYYGFREFVLKLGTHMKPYPEYQHELGGATVFYNTRADWDNYIKPTWKELLGTRPVPEELLKIAENPKKPDVKEEFGDFLK